MIGVMLKMGDPTRYAALHVQTAYRAALRSSTSIQGYSRRGAPDSPLEKGG